MYLVSLGILKDVDPANAEDVFVQDIDYTFVSTQLCFRWAGFNHPSSEIAFKLGVGSTQSSADILPASAIADGLKQYCVTVPEMNHLDIYYGMLTASTESGQVTQSSDGVRYIDSEYELTTAQVHDGPGCFHARFELLDFSGTLSSGNTINDELTLTIGRWYTIELVLTDNNNIPSMQIIDIEVTVNGDALEITQATHLKTDGKRHIFASVFAAYANSPLTVTNNLDVDITVEALYLKLCSFDVDYHSSQNVFNAWWNFYFEDTITPHVTHYEVAIEEELDPGTFSFVAGYRSSHLDTHYVFTGLSLLTGSKYFTVVRPCMQHICMPAIKSDGFQVFLDEPDIGEIVAQMDFEYDDEAKAVMDITIEWEPFSLPNDENHDFLYVYTISTSPDVANHIDEWHTYEGSTESSTLKVCCLDILKRKH